MLCCESAAGGSGGAGTGCSRNQGGNRMMGSNGPMRQPDSLLDITARLVAQNEPFQKIEERYDRIPEPVQRRIIYWSFPRNEKDICMYSSLSRVSSINSVEPQSLSFCAGLKLVESGCVEDVLQVGFHLSGVVWSYPPNHNHRHSSSSSSSNVPSGGRNDLPYHPYANVNVNNNHHHHPHNNYIGNNNHHHNPHNHRPLTPPPLHQAAPLPPPPGGPPGGPPMAAGAMAVVIPPPPGIAQPVPPQYNNNPNIDRDGFNNISTSSSSGSGAGHMEENKKIQSVSQLR